MLAESNQARMLRRLGFPESIICSKPSAHRIRVEPVFTAVEASAIGLLHPRIVVERRGGSAGSGPGWGRPVRTGVVRPLRSRRGLLARKTAPSLMCDVG